MNLLLNYPDISDARALTGVHCSYGRHLLDGLKTFAVTLSLLMLCGITLAIRAQTNGTVAPPSLSPAQASPQAANATRTPLVIEGMTTSDVFGFNRSIEVRGTVTHGVLVLDGDLIVVGRIEGDVACLGGSIVQREGSYIGGDVIVIGGAYHHGKQAPGRDPASTTVMYAGYEQELRELARDPASLFAPELSSAYIGGRLLAVLFWFVVSLAATAAAPSVVSRAGARLQLTSLRVALIGCVSAVVMVCGVSLSLGYLPNAISALVGITSLLLLIIAYLFGRVVIHAVTGRLLQRVLLKERHRSPSIALLLGSVCWVVLLSLPYVWTLLIGGLLVVSLGLALTARYRVSWKRSTAS